MVFINVMFASGCSLMPFACSCISLEGSQIETLLMQVRSTPGHAHCSSFMANRGGSSNKIPSGFRWFSGQKHGDGRSIDDFNGHRDRSELAPMDLYQHA